MDSKRQAIEQQLDSLFNRKYDNGMIVKISCKKCGVVLYKAEETPLDTADSVADRMVAHYAIQHSLPKPVR